MGEQQRQVCFERQAPKITAVFTIPTEITGTKGRPIFSSGNKASTRIQPHSALKGLKVWFQLATIVWRIFAGEIKSFHYWVANTACRFRNGFKQILRFDQ